MFDHCQTQLHPWRCRIPVSEQLEHEPKFNLQKWLTAHAQKLMIDSVHERFGERYFTAHLDKMERNVDFRHRIVYFDQWWVVTLH